METVLEKYHNLCNYLERETIGTEVALYGASGVMLLIAYVKRKPAYLVRQFKKPAHIPEKLVNERIMHTGLIKDIQQRDQDTLLLINHRPLISLFSSRNRVLPIKLPGVKINGNGYSWLQSCIVGREATFLPLQSNKSLDYVVCQLCLVHPPKGHKLLDISETLLKLRFAKFLPDAASSAQRNDKYYRHLQRVEKAAQSSAAWQLWAARYPWFLGKVQELKAAILPKQKLLPELVRTA